MSDTRTVDEAINMLLKEASTYEMKFAMSSFFDPSTKQTKAKMLVLPDSGKWWWEWRSHNFALYVDARRMSEPSWHPEHRWDYGSDKPMPEEQAKAMLPKALDVIKGKHRPGHDAKPQLADGRKRKENG